MEISINFDTKRKLIVDWFYENKNDDFCKIFLFKSHFVIRFLWFRFEFNLPIKRMPDEEDCI